jgi:hypothetical protein
MPTTRKAAADVGANPHRAQRDRRLGRRRNDEAWCEILRNDRRRHRERKPGPCNQMLEDTHETLP